jgi:hypothetical protein
MRRNFLFFAIAGAMLLAVAGWNLLADAPEQRVEVFLRDGYKVGGVPLKAGKYIVIHKNVADHEGEACTFFYRAPYRSEKDIVAKAHCQPVQGAVAKEFTLRSTTQPDGSSVVHSIQFAGSTEIHNLQPGS